MINNRTDENGEDWALDTKVSCGEARGAMRSYLSYKHTKGR